MTWLHWLGAALLFLGSTAAGFALRQELRLRLRLLTAVIDSLNLLRSDIVGRLLPLPEAPSGGDRTGAAERTVRRACRRYHGRRPAVFRELVGCVSGAGHACARCTCGTADAGRTARKV